MSLSKKASVFCRVVHSPTVILTICAILCLLVLSGCKQQKNDKHEELTDVKKWFTSQTSRYDVITGETRNNHNVDGMTIVFGDIADGIYDFSSDKIVPAEFSEARVIYDDGKDATTVISNNTPYMLILDGEIEVKDIEYSGDGTNVKYSDYFSDDLMTDVTSEETGFE